MIFTELKGDLFNAPITDSLAHCISEDCRMGKGIAVLFRDKFGGVQELKRQVAEGAKTGKVAVLERDGRYIYYLITKGRATDKPTYQTLRGSLESMRGHAVEHCVKNVSLPRIGCGLDGLEWNKVRDMIKDVFGDLDVEINVYSK